MFFIKITDLFKIYIPHMPACSLTQLQTHCTFTGVLLSGVTLRGIKRYNQHSFNFLRKQKQLVKIILY